MSRWAQWVLAFVFGAGLALAIVLITAPGTGTPPPPPPEPAPNWPVIPDERREAAAKWMVEMCAAANPHSDEEPEDLVLEVGRQAQLLFGKPAVCEIRAQGGNYYWVPVTR